MYTIYINYYMQFTLNTYRFDILDIEYGVVTADEDL